MKKKRLLSVVAISAFLSLGVVTLAGCDGDRIIKGETYTVNYNQSSDFTVSGLNSSYKEGASVTFTVTVTNSEKEIDTVTVNGSTITGSNGTYSFSMPAANVTIQINLKDKETQTDTHELTATVTGSVIEGSTFSLLVYFDGSLLTSGYTITSESSLVRIEGTSIYAVSEGEATLTITYVYDDETYSTTVNVTIEDNNIMTIAEAKAAADDTFVTVRGVVTATSGTSAYISDSTGGIFIYNWSYNNQDTAIVNKSWTVGQSVEVHAQKTTRLSNGKSTNAIQLSSYDGQRIDEVYAYALEEDLDYIDPIELTEETYNELEPMDQGAMYTFNATYVSGAPSATAAEEITFNIGASEVTLRTDGGSSRVYDIYIEDLIQNWNTLALQSGDEVKITAPLTWWYDDPQFSYYGRGVTIERTSEEFIRINGESEVRVGNDITLTAEVVGIEEQGVTWSSSDSTIATVSTSGVVTGVKEGTVTITATSTANPNIKGTKTIVVRPKTVTYDISQITTENINYTVRGEIVAKTTGGLVIHDGKAGAYIFGNSFVNQYNIGDKVEVSGTVSKYNGMFQFSYQSCELTPLDELEVTIPEATTLTAEIANSWKTNVDNFGVTDMQKYRWNTTVTESGGYKITNLDGSNVTIEPSYYPDEDNLIVGEQYTIEAYFAGYSTNHDYAAVYIASVTPISEEPIDPTGITIQVSSNTISIGGTATLSATLTPAGATGDVTYEITSGSDYITLEGNVVTGKALGSASIVGKVGTLTSNEITITVSDEAPSNPLDNYQTVNSVSELLQIDPNTLEDSSTFVDSKLYQVTGILTNWEGDKYGNFSLTDKTTGETISIYGPAGNTMDVFAYDTETQNYSFNTPTDEQRFDTLVEDGTISVGDEITLRGLYVERWAGGSIVFKGSYIETVNQTEEIEYNITKDTMENGDVSLSIDKGTFGTTVNVTVLPAEGYKINKLFLNDTLLEVSDNKASFEICVGPNIISAEFIDENIDTTPTSFNINFSGTSHGIESTYQSNTIQTENGNLVFSSCNYGSLASSYQLNLGSNASSTAKPGNLPVSILKGIDETITEDGYNFNDRYYYGFYMDFDVKDFTTLTLQTKSYKSSNFDTFSILESTDGGVTWHTIEASVSDFVYTYNTSNIKARYAFVISGTNASMRCPILSLDIQ